MAARWPADSQAGQGLTEYAMILTLVAVVCIIALTLLGGDIVATLNDYIAGTIAGTMR
jgi:Flp pilus assembly pilin Flp